MKKSILLAMAVSMIALASCKKQETAATSNPAAPGASTPTHTQRPSDYRVYENGTTLVEIGVNFIETDSSIVVGIDSLTVFVFRGYTSAVNWTAISSSDPSYIQTGKAALRTKLTTIKAFRNEATAAGILTNDAAMLELANVYWPDEEIQGEGDRHAGNGNKTTASGLLFKNAGYSGGTFVMPPIVWNMPSSWNDVVSSMIGAGTLLCEHKWFGGSKAYWFIGGWYDMNGWYINNRTSSFL